MRARHTSDHETAFHVQVNAFATATRAISGFIICIESRYRTRDYSKRIHATLEEEVQTDEVNISLNLRCSFHASPNEVVFASTSAATLTPKAMAFLSDTKDSRASECSKDRLHALVTQILADENNLDITLADLTATPPLYSDGGSKEFRDQIPEDEREPTDMAIDAQNEINQPSSAH